MLKNLSVKSESRAIRFNMLLAVWFFVFASAVSWLFVNGGIVESDSGFDPLRYEYFARIGLPENLANSSSYRIVLLLEHIYQFLPFFYGFTIFIAICASVVALADSQKRFAASIICPISFFYMGQTGKDGISILALAAAIVVYSYGIRLSNAGTLLIIILAVFIRPALLIVLPPLFVLYKFGLRWSIVISLAVGITFLVTYDLEGTLIVLQDVVSDPSSGEVVQFAREMTFGYDLAPIALRIILLFLAPLLQPITTIYKAVMSGEMFVFFEAACQALFLLLLIHTRTFRQFLISAIPFVIIIASTSPFFHFRYIAIVYPALWAYCLWVKRSSLVLSAS